MELALTGTRRQGGFQGGVPLDCVDPLGFKFFFLLTSKERK